jgi:hypothetical protein
LAGPDTKSLNAFVSRHIEGTGDAGQAADATLAAWGSIDRALQPIFGKNGVAGLYRRSLHLAAAEHPWLETDRPGGENRDIDVDALRAALAQQSTADAKAGAAAFLRHFDALLSSLVGPSLTARLLRPVWGGDPQEPNEQDTRS